METIPRRCGQLHEAAKRRLHWKRPWCVCYDPFIFCKRNSPFNVLTLICFIIVLSAHCKLQLFGRVLITAYLVCSCMNLAPGYYIGLDTSGHATGDIGRLLSPTFHLDHPAPLRFRAYFQAMALDVDASLTVYLSLDLPVSRQLLLSVSPSSNWRLHTVCLPQGDHRLLFEATLGEQYHTAIALDNIDLVLGQDCLEQRQMCTFVCLLFKR